jgi:hypothetical protein
MKPEESVNKVSHRLKFMLKLYEYQKFVNLKGISWKEVESEIILVDDKKRNRAILSKCYDSLYDMWMLDEKFVCENNLQFKRIMLTPEACDLAKTIRNDLISKKIKWK